MVFLLIALPSGCCMFMPCHPATRAVGHVTDLKDQPIKGASVKLYSTEYNTNSDGCFAFDLADAFPFQLSASATGFQGVEVPSKAGFFIIEIRMSPTNSNSSSEVLWKEIDSDDYRNIKQCN